MGMIWHGFSIQFQWWWPFCDLKFILSHYMIWSSSEIKFHFTFSCGSSHGIEGLFHHKIWYGHHQRPFFSESPTKRFIIWLKNSVVIVNTILWNENGTANNPIPGECVCNDWLFHSCSCNHIYRFHRGIVCGKTKWVRPSINTRCCANHGEMLYIAKVKVLGPCKDVGCSWWSVRFGDFDVLGKILENDYNMAYVLLMHNWIMFG